MKTSQFFFCYLCQNFRARTNTQIAGDRIRMVSHQLKLSKKWLASSHQLYRAKVKVEVFRKKWREESCDDTLSICSDDSRWTRWLGPMLVLVTSISIWVTEVKKKDWSLFIAHYVSWGVVLFVILYYDYCNTYCLYSLSNLFIIGSSGNRFIPCPVYFSFFGVCVRSFVHSCHTAY